MKSMALMTRNLMRSAALEAFGLSFLDISAKRCRVAMNDAVDDIIDNARASNTSSSCPLKGEKLSKTGERIIQDPSLCWGPC